ncbi:MAG: hypothetical protein JXA89_15615 [Anaerolineae bacterium]|nr:hypothetical protein [Anaerolineae bacterium]
MGRGRGSGSRRGSGAGRGSGQGSGRMGGPNAAGPGGTCVCPSCGERKSHTVGVPCYQVKCPKCGTQMIREQ